MILSVSMVNNFREVRKEQVAQKKDLRVVTEATLSLMQSKRKAGAKYFLSSTPSPTSSDELIVKVRASKVNIRSGAGTNHSPIMTVARNTRLTVESEVGDWFRVYTPNASRGYILKDLVEVYNEKV